MRPHLVLLAAAFAPTAFAQSGAHSERRSPEQVFRFLDKDSSGTLSKAELGALEERVPSLRQRPEAVGAMFSRLDKDGNGSLTLEEYGVIANVRPGTASSEPKGPAAPPKQEEPSIENQPPTAEGVGFFEKNIRPVLMNRCYQCHSADAKKIKGGLVLDTREGIRRGGENGPAVVPRDLEASLLIQAIHYETDIAMPPKKAGGKLPDAVIKDFEKWVQMGAPDPRAGAAKLTKKPDTWEAAKHWWAWQPPRKTPAPEVKDAAWPKNEIDRFLRSAMEAKGLKPVGDADKLTLLRRVTFDLTGLPPTPQEITAFSSDGSPTAFSKVVDRLFNSPQFGERWGRHWLDPACWTRDGVPPRDAIACCQTVPCGTRRRSRRGGRVDPSHPLPAGAFFRFLERHGRFARPREFRVVTESPVFERGDVNRPGEKVPRGFLSVLTHKPPSQIPAGSSGRRELAEWMLTDSNPLTARVMVNRVWQWLFGQGLVSTPDNFGTTGKLPSNQALLDTLAVKFRESGWSMKRLIREIVLSHAYQLSSTFDESNFAVDPENALVWTDDYGYEAVENKVHVHDLHATILHLLGLDHERLTYRYAGRDFRLTDVHGNVVKEILA